MESNESISDGEIPVLKQQMIYVFYLIEIKKYREEHRGTNSRQRVGEISIQVLIKMHLLIEIIFLSFNRDTPETVITIPGGQ